jgi:hypothetical protein
MADRYKVVYTIPASGSGKVTTTEMANSAAEARQKVEKRVSGSKVISVVKG